MRIRKVSSRAVGGCWEREYHFFSRDECADRSSHPKWSAQNTCTQEQQKMYSVNLCVCVNICMCVYVTMIFKEEVLKLRGSGRNMGGAEKGKGRRGKNDVKAVLRCEILKKRIRIL